MPNAILLLTGNIYVTRGLYRKLASDHLLAATLAHKMGHAVAQDGRQPRGGSDIRLQRELAADRFSLQLLEAAGYDSQALGQLLALIENHQPRGWGSRKIAAATDACLSASTIPNR